MMCEFDWMDDRLGPLKRDWVLVAGGGEPVNGRTDLLGSGGAEAAQDRSREDAEPDLHLVEPRGMGGRVVEVHLRVTSQPAVVLGLMSAQVIQDDVQLGVRVLGHQ